MRRRRYPLAPFFELTGWSMTRVTEIAAANAEELRRRRSEGVTERIADRLAVAAGFHAFVIWPEMADHVIADTQRECADEMCRAWFVPTNAKHRYCTDRCRSRASSRRRYRMSPDHAAKQRARAAAYRRDNARVKAVKDALYREKNRDQLRAKQRERDRRAAAQRQKEAA